MRIAVFLLAILVFAAGLILDTGALLALVGGFLWEHALTAAATALLVAALAVGWRRLRRRTGAKPRSRAGQARRAAGPRQKPADDGRGRSRTGKRASAK
jgi:membrane protein implicated in regulation of membrane protease activity